MPISNQAKQQCLEGSETRKYEPNLRRIGFMDSHECPATKCCSKCKTDKPLSEFYLSKGRPMSSCKTCYAVASKRNYEANREKRLAQCAARREAKASEIKQYMSDYYIKNREAVLERTKAYQAREDVQAREKERHARRWIANRDELIAKRKQRLEDPKVNQAWLEYLKDHYRSNKPAYLAKWAKRRAQKLNATPAWADMDAITAVYEEAKRLTLETGVQHEVDHIVPLVHPLVCGLHVEWNLQILTWTANRSKSNKLVEDIVRHSSESRRAEDKEPLCN